jgi:hypothetical protein
MPLVAIVKSVLFVALAYEAAGFPPSIHVRQLPATEGNGWVVRVIGKANVDERHRENTNDKFEA